VAFFFSVAGLFVATQYEMPFKLSISTFHVSVMASTPATASHKAFHPS
jgi:diacylglycerol kinase